MITKTDKFCKQVIFQEIQTVPDINEAEMMLALSDCLCQEEAAESVQSTAGLSMFTDDLM